jgi:PAS domain-containing protein
VSAWYEIVVHGAEAAIRAFVAGFCSDRGDEEHAILFGDDLDLEPESLGERLKELFLTGSHRVLLAPAPLADSLVRALESRGREAGIALDGRHIIRGASFTYRAETFARPLAEQLQAALATSPAGIEIVDRHDDEEEHPDAEAVDLYAPVHRYAFRASGRIVGEFPGVLEMNGRLRGMDSVELSRLHLDAMPAP